MAHAMNERGGLRIFLPLTENFSQPLLEDPSFDSV